MDGILDFFSPQAGQARRRRLDELAAGATYYIPPELRGLLGLVAEANPVRGIERAGVAAGEIVAPDATGLERVGAGGRMLSEMAGVVAPAAVAGRVGMPAAEAIQEGLLGVSAGARDVGRAVAERLNQPGPMPTLYSNPVPGLMDESGGIRAYHGSPHTFERFDMSKIGTGEGAQAFGHGLYFAENEGVARGYRDALTSGLSNWRIDGVPAGRLHASSNAEDLTKLQVAQAVRSGKTVEEAIDWVQSQYRGKAKSRFEIPENIAFFNEEIARLDAMRANPPVIERNPGRLYEVRIDADPEDFLDWDKPFASMDDLERFAAKFDAIDPVLRKRIEDFGYVRQQMGQPMPDGNDIIREVMGGVGGKEAARAAEIMREAGIPGIRYLDAGSRYTLDNLPDNVITREARQFLDQAGGDPDKALSLFNQSNPVERWAQSERNEVAKVIASAKKTATRNYVVFDDRLISIVRMYGIAGAAALLGMSVADVEAALAAQPPQQPAARGLLGEQ